MNSAARTNPSGTGSGGEMLRMAHMRWMPAPKVAGTAMSTTDRPMMTGRARRTRRSDSSQESAAAPPTHATTKKYTRMTGRWDSSSGVLLSRSRASPRNITRKLATSTSGKTTSTAGARRRKRMASTSKRGRNSPSAAKSTKGAPTTKFASAPWSSPTRSATRPRTTPGSVSLTMCPRRSLKPEPSKRSSGTPGTLRTHATVARQGVAATAAHRMRLRGPRGARKNTGGTSKRRSALAMKKCAL